MVLKGATEVHCDIKEIMLKNVICTCCVSRGAVRSAASSYAAMRMVVGSRPVLVIA